MRKTILAGILLIIIILVSPFSTVWAAGNSQTILIEVKGLSCPFCSYGLEKKLKALNGVEGVEIHMRKGIAEIQVKQGVAVSDAAINEAVKDAGFDPGSIKRGKN
jgi:copper chaperone CopZ